MKNIIARVLSHADQGSNSNRYGVVGMTTPKVQKMLNLMVKELPSDEAYFEVGVLRGSTLIGALHGNTSAEAYACDNWSQFRDWGGVDAREAFFSNLKKYEADLPKVNVIESDVWEYLKKPTFKKPIGILFYDGDHTEESQKRILLDIEPYLAKEAILIIDDYDHPPAKAGSEAGMKFLKCASSHFFYRSAADGYHNGIGINHILRA